jgi:hypothetical protein
MPGAYFQEFPEPGNAVLVVLAFGWNGKNDIIIAEAFGVPISVKGICHFRFYE